MPLYFISAFIGAVLGAALFLIGYVVGKAPTKKKTQKTRSDYAKVIDEDYEAGLPGKGELPISAGAVLGGRTPFLQRVAAEKRRIKNEHE
jgi:hypothetical protein